MAHDPPADRDLAEAPQHGANATLDTWKPLPGQVVLMEPQSDEPCDCLTGLVLHTTDAVTVQIALNPGCSGAHDHLKVLASFFAPDALYRVTGELHMTRDTDRVVDFEALAVERVQRRNNERARCQVQATLSGLDDGDDVSVRGTTLDLGSGGCRVLTDRPFPREDDPTLLLHFPDDESAISLARILETTTTDAGWEYRLVFADLPEEEAQRIGRLARRTAALQADQQPA